MNREGMVRKDILDAARSAGKIGAHIAPSLSEVEICLAVLDSMDEGDKIILSKGHGALGYYAAMHQTGKISDEQFASFEINGGEYPGQPSKSETNCIDYSSGSLGMGLSYAAGLAYGNRKNKYFVILGDGELNEGSCWEAAIIIKRLDLSNVIAVIDQNGLQSDGRTADVTGMDLSSALYGFGWNIVSCDGHDICEIKKAIKAVVSPTVILAKTTKGKGVSFMENNNEWHHHELRQDDYDKAIIEIGERYGLCEK